MMNKKEKLWVGLHPFWIQFQVTSNPHIRQAQQVQSELYTKALVFTMYYKFQHHSLCIKYWSIMHYEVNAGCSM